MDNGTLELSVIVMTPDTYATIRRTVRRLKAQDVRHLIEVVIVAPSAQGLGEHDNDLQGFHSVRFVEVGSITSTAAARAAGVCAASAPIVAFVEDHSFPANGWAKALLEAHREPWAAVGPAIANANPRTLISWANLAIEYSEWLDPCPSGTVDHLPGHNASYKRAHLLEYGDRLEAMIEAESVLQWDLRARGHRLYLESTARTFHQNFSTPLSWVPLRFHAGRLFASARARGWPAWRRAFYAMCAPAIPLVRCVRIVRELRKPGRRRGLLPRILPALTAGLVLDGLGEMVGYATGGGGAMKRLSDMEFHRERYLRKEEQRGRALA